MDWRGFFFSFLQAMKNLIYFLFVWPTWEQVGKKKKGGNPGFSSWQQKINGIIEKINGEKSRRWVRHLWGGWRWWILGLKSPKLTIFRGIWLFPPWNRWEKKPNNPKNRRKFWFFLLPDKKKKKMGLLRKLLGKKAGGEWGKGEDPALGNREENP